jgi:excisionase family DNA binding protein
MTEREKYVRHPEAAEYLAVPSGWLYANAERLGIPRYRIGERQFRYKISELSAWLEAQRDRSGAA